MLLSLHVQNKDALAKSKAGGWEYDIISPAYKCNMIDILAALGISQLNRYEKILSRRREIVKKYNNAFRNEDVQVLDHLTTNSKSSCHLYMTRLLGKSEEFRNKFIKKLAEAGITANVHYKPLPMLTAYKNLGFNTADFPNAYEMFKNEVTLPLHTLLTDDEVDYIIKIYKENLQ